MVDRPNATLVVSVFGVTLLSSLMITLAATNSNFVVKSMTHGTISMEFYCEYIWMT